MKYAGSLGLDTTKFKGCLESREQSEEITKRMAEGQKVGITGTPAFLIGITGADGKVKAVKKIVGAQPYTALKMRSKSF